jgi:hypothetical protein
MNAGDTFFITDRRVDAHLWIVISDPSKDSERVILVSATTYESHKESVCLLEAGDHPAISHKTCIAYNETRMTSLEKLRALQQGGHLRVQPPVSNAVLARIRDGVSNSRRIKYKYVEILLEQEVIE